MNNNKIRIKFKKGVKYSICSCGLSKKIPYCDNQHRVANESDFCSYKSVKFVSNKNIELELSCSNWNLNEK